MSMRPTGIHVSTVSCVSTIPTNNGSDSFVIAVLVEQFADYDLIVGGVADDKVFYAVEMFLKGIWDMETTLSALRFYNVNDQWCFVSQHAADTLLTFARSWEGPRQ